MHHYLILKWAEEPESPQWGDNMDWEVSHPPDCPGHMEEPLEGLQWSWWQYDCAIEWEVSNAGRDVFGPVGMYPDHPCVTAIEHWVEKYYPPQGVGVEIDTGIRWVDE